MNAESATPGRPKGPGSRGGGPRGRGGRAPAAGFCRAQDGADEGPRTAGPGGGRYRRSILETSLLTLLASQTSHGYDLMEQVSDLAADLVCIDPGSMYRLLRGLEEQGLVTSSWQTADAGPSRRVYEITEQGIEALGIMAESLALQAKSMQRLASRAAEAVQEARTDESKE